MDVWKNSNELNEEATIPPSGLSDDAEATLPPIYDDKANKMIPPLAPNEFDEDLTIPPPVFNELEEETTVGARKRFAWRNKGATGV